MRLRNGAGSSGRLLATVVRGAGVWLAPLVALAVLGAVASVALPAMLGRAVDQLAAAGREELDWSTAHATLAVTIALVGITVGADTTGRLLAGLGAAQTTGQLRRQLTRHVLGVGPGLARQTSEGDLVARIVGSTGTTAQAVTVVSGLAEAVILPLGGLVALAVIDPWLAVTFGVGMLAIGGSVRVYLRDAGVANAGYLEAQGSIAGRLVDALAGSRTIAAARTTDLEADRVLAPLGGLRHHGHAVWRSMARLAFRGEPVMLLAQVGVVAMAGLGVAAGRLSAGEVLAASRYAVMAAGVGGIVDELAGLSRARAAAGRLDQVLREPAVRYGEQSLPSGPGELVFQGVTAGPSDAPVLRRVDLTVPGRQVTALVGRSGAGKSLAAALAGRLCDPTQGHVCLDGVPLDQLDRPSLRRAAVYAFERPARLGESIADAIAFGVDRPPPEQVRAAARAARADGFIGRLPGGYQAPLAGTPMSGGELQRIGLARAMAHDARLLILDDATSSLDTATEAEITTALTARSGDSAEGGQTRLIVTHRAATAARADLVAWLHDGRIRAVGAHRELWADPDYRAIFQPPTATRSSGTDGAGVPAGARESEERVASGGGP